ncbi:MAG TPA: ammonium transporter [Thermoplasmata archaeon]|nr:ammonium transporter [Thermoplasmata archaeon]
MLDLVNNLWVLIAALLVFTMTISVGLLEVGELGLDFANSLYKTVLMTGAAIVVMAVVGFNTAFAPTWGGVIGNPTYGPGFFLGGFSTDPNAVWWSMGPNYFGTGLSGSTYFLFETAFAAVTYALVGVVFLKKVKAVAYSLFAIPYFALIWALPAAWIWNPTGWLAKLGMVDFAGGLVVHGAAGAAGLGILVQVWREERAKGHRVSPAAPIQVNPGWLTLAILLLWVGWFGFNPGSVLAFNGEAMVVVITTFLAAAAAGFSFLICQAIGLRKGPTLIDAVNGILMGLIVITPLAGFVSPGSALILGLFGGPVFYLAETYIATVRWFSDPVGLVPGHLVGGLFGVTMIGFFAQTAYAAPAGAPGLPNGILFGGGMSALHQIGLEWLGILAVLAVVFVLSFVIAWILAELLGGITGTRPHVDEPSA